MVKVLDEFGTPAEPSVTSLDGRGAAVTAFDESGRELWSWAWRAGAMKTPEVAQENRQAD
jgi:hypothetical protein